MSRRPVLLDLYCGAGGAAVGYHQAGFEVVGIDVMPQPRYPYEFHQADVRDLFDGKLPTPRCDVIHASPPCQSFTAYARAVEVHYHGEYLDATRWYCKRSGRKWVIENVMGAPLRPSAILCGSMFGLGVQRHRVFESNVKFWTPRCRHNPPSVEVGGRLPLAVQKRAMGIDWMIRRELTEAIPPAYTKFLGHQLIEQLR